MTEPTTLPRWGQYASGGTLLTVALVAGATSLTINTTYGYQAGLASAITFGLADIGKIAIPIVAGLIGWSRQMKITAAVCVAVSLWCAVNYFADHSGQQLLSREHAASVYRDKAETISILASRAETLQKMAKDEADRGGCGDKCRSLQDRADEALAALAAARATRAGAKPVEISGLAMIAATVTGSDPQRLARLSSAVTAVLFLALLEALVWLSVPGMRAIRRCGELLRAIEEGRGKHWESKREGTLHSTRTQAARDAGLSEHQQKTAQPRDARGRFAKKDWTKVDAYEMETV